MVCPRSGRRSGSRDEDVGGGGHGRVHLHEVPALAGRTQVVYGVGDPSADLMFIGEAPGFHEDKHGEPFVGGAGQLLNQLLS